LPLEVIAIRVAISGEPENADRWVVSAALVVAAIGIVGLVLMPWIENIEPGPRR
jgi:hypothetical protein